MPRLALSCPRHLEQLSSHHGHTSWMRRVMLPTASWIAFASDVMSGCHAFYNGYYNAPRCYPICHCFCLSFLGFLTFPLAASLSKQHTDVMSYLSSGIAFYTVFQYIRRVTSQCAWRHRTNKKSNTSKRQQQHDILRGLIFPNGRTP